MADLKCELATETAVTITRAVPVHLVQVSDLRSSWNGHCLGSDPRQFYSGGTFLPWFKRGQANAIASEAVH